MSEETGRGGGPLLLLAELEATELLLRSMAVENLDYRGILQVERIAHRVCTDLLAQLGAEMSITPAQTQGRASNMTLSAEPEGSAEPEDELLAGGATLVGTATLGALGLAGAATDGITEFEGELEAIEEADAPGDDPTDETPASSSEVLLRWSAEGQPALVGSSDLPVEEPLLEDEDPTLADTSASLAPTPPVEPESFEYEQIPDEPQAVEEADFVEEVDFSQDPEPEVSEEPASPEDEPRWVEDAADSQPSYLPGERWDQAPDNAAAAPPPSGSDPWAHLVTFSNTEAEGRAEERTGETDDADDAHDDPWAEQRRAEQERQSAVPQRPRAQVIDPGADALSTMDNRVSREEVLPEVELELELELDPTPGQGDDEAAFEEDATLIRAAPTPPPTDRRATPVAPPSRPPRAAGTPIGGTAGLYGSAAVPTIRDSDDPRPRAAAVQLNAAGTGGRVLGAEEDDEPIEIGEASADEVDENDSGGGFALKVQEYETVEPDFEEDEEEEELEEEEPEPEPEPVGPTVEALQALFDAAQTAATSGNLQGGADLYSDLIDQDPDNVEAHVARGRLYLDLGDYSRAMSDFMVAEDLASTDPEPLVAIGDLYFARKDYRKAIEYFDQALTIAPNHAMAFCRRGISHYYRKNYPDAVTDLERAKKLDRDIQNIDTYISMAKKKIGK